MQGDQFYVRVRACVYIRMYVRTIAELSRHLWRLKLRYKSPHSYFISPGRLVNHQFHTLQWVDMNSVHEVHLPIEFCYIRIYIIHNT